MKNKFYHITIITTILLSACNQLPNNDDSQLSLKYLGAAGWEIKDENSTILVDPYLSRIKLVGNSTTKTISSSAMNRDWGNDKRKKYYREDRFTPDTSVINSHIVSADYIFVHHTHFDHAADVPYIAKRTGAKVIGTESLANILRANGVPENQIITVKGGEDYSFGNFSVKVLPSLHSALRKKQYFSSAIIPKNVNAPMMIKEFVEGNSLMYFFRFNNNKVLTMGSMNFIENEVRGLQPDVLLAGSANSRKEIYNYTERLLSLTNYPKVIIPTHWDDFRIPYGASQSKAAESKGVPFIEEVKILSPNSKTFLPVHLELININKL
tara:strand:- start:1114 stop:2085 length:972 start_codon:yes stop_codon:yes gene_type:complete